MQSSDYSASVENGGCCIKSEDSDSNYSPLHAIGPGHSNSSDPTPGHTVQNPHPSGPTLISDCDSKNTRLRVDANPCNITITVPATMKPPIYMYYKMSNYYQNHRRYVKSRSDMQLVSSLTCGQLKTCLCSFMQLSTA